MKREKMHTAQNNHTVAQWVEVGGGGGGGNKEKRPNGYKFKEGGDKLVFVSLSFNYSTIC